MKACIIWELLNLCIYLNQDPRSNDGAFLSVDEANRHFDLLQAYLIEACKDAEPLAA